MSRPCVLCGFDLAPTELVTCALCVSLVRLDLTSIEHCYALLPGLLGRPDGASLGAVMGGLSGEAALPGGDVLAMLGPGGESGEGDPADPPAVAFELWSWREDWADLRGEPVVQTTDVPSLVGWLGTRLSWCMSYHPAAVEFAADMARIRGRLESATGTLDAPERGAACPYCRVTLQRAYGSAGRDDDWSCPRCHRGFNERLYVLALRGELAELAHSHPTYRSARSEQSVRVPDGDHSRRRQQMITHSCRDGGWPCGEHREGARWSGSQSGHCSGCGELFISEAAFDLHINHDSSGHMVCVDVKTALRKDGEPRFERVEKPKWEPPYAWRLYIPDRPVWSGLSA